MSFNFTNQVSCMLRWLGFYLTNYYVICKLLNVRYIWQVDELERALTDAKDHFRMYREQEQEKPHVQFQSKIDLLYLEKVWNIAQLLCLKYWFTAHKYESLIDICSWCLLILKFWIFRTPCELVLCSNYVTI